MQRTKRLPELKLPAKASAWYVISSVISRGVGVFGTPIFTRLLSAEEYGVYPLYNTWLGLFTVIATLEIGGGVLTRGLQRHVEEKEAFLSSALGLCFSSTLFFSAIYFTLSDQINLITGLTTELTLALLLNVLFNTAVNFYTARLKFDYRYKVTTLISLFTAFVSPTVSFFIVTRTPLRAEGRIIGALAATAAVAIPISFKIFRDGKKIIDFKIWRYLLKITLPLLPHYLSHSIIIRITEITVNRAFGTEAFGKYSVAISLGLSLNMLTNGLLSALSPWTLRKIRAGELERVKEVLLLITRLLCVISLLFLAVVPETVKIITPKGYRDALPAVYPLALSCVPMFLCGAVSSAEMYYERSSVTSTPSVIAAAVTAIAVSVLLPLTDYRFAGVFLFFAYVLLIALNYPFFKKLCGKSPLLTRETLKAGLATAAYAFLLFTLRNRFLPRLALLVPLVPILLFCVKGVLREIKE